uniref:Ig-like domain-containing protein n=1 Tax=Ceratitis capitata TaxID=7213 RepID=W8BIT1_CERCA
MTVTFKVGETYAMGVRFTSCCTKTQATWSRILFFVGIFFFISDISTALNNVSVSIPSAVKRGDNAILICNYNLEYDNLYTVKWYRGRREFYRYTPKENPALKIFPASGGYTVDMTESNATHVFIRNPTSGKYSCEVSADAPSFDTFFVSGEMEVVELPTQRPVITGVHSRYRLGDIINGNCSSDFSKPAANLTWWINDMQVPPHSVRTFGIQRHFVENLESAVLEINFIVTLHHFIKGRLKLKCSARIYDIYVQEAEKLIEEDRPRILASGRSPELNIYPFDHLPSAEGFDEHNELYLTHNNNHPSAAARSELSRESQLLTATTAFVLITAINGFLKSTIEAIIQAAKGSHLQAASEKVENATENKIILQHCQINANGGELNKEYAEQIELLFTSGAHKTR